MDRKGIEVRSGLDPNRSDTKVRREDGTIDAAPAPAPTAQPQRPPSSGEGHNLNAEDVETLRRERSNNGWGCNVDVEAGQNVPPQQEQQQEQQQQPEEESSEQEEKDPFEVGWDGGDSDPMCPRSFPTWRKWLIIIITSFGSLCVTNASAAYTATYAQMDAEFGNSQLVATLGLSFFVLGIALGPFWSPLAEFYGRRPIYLCSFAGFIIWLIPSAVAKNIETMIVARFFQGLAGSAFLSVSGGTVSDLFTRDTMLAPMSVFTLAPFVGPSLGPLFGGLINTYANWRWTHYMLLIWAGVLLVALALFVPETYHPVLLKRKAEKLRKSTGDQRWRAPIEKMTRSVTRTVAYSLLRPFQILVYEPMAVILNIYTAILLGMLYLFFGAFALIFRTNHGFNLWQIGLTFMGLLVSMTAACLSMPFWSRFRQNLVAKRQKKTGVLKAEPEDQLPPVIAGAPLITGGLFWFGFTTYPGIHWIVPIIGSAVFGLGVALAFTGVFSFLVDAYPRYAASALASNALVRCVFAAAFPLFGIQMYEGLGYQWATALVGFVTLALMPFPYIFYRYGKRIRSRSRFATTS